MNLNNDISQEEHISWLQKHKKKDVEIIAKQVDADYEKYVNGDDSLLESIIQTIDKKYREVVVRKLYVPGCYDDEGAHTALQEARIAVWNLLENSRKKQEVKPNFFYFCKKIYYYKAIDAIRSKKKELDYYGKDYVDPKKKKQMSVEEKSCWGAITSLDKMLPSENDTIGSALEDKIHKGNRPDNMIEDEEKRKFFDISVEIYCKMLTRSDDEPPKILALYYSRILPHILHIYSNIETIPDKKAGSPKWAREKMGLRTIGELSEESEGQLQQYILEELTWCEAYWKQLDLEVDVTSGTQIMRNIIFAKQYNEKQIGHMTDKMHKAVTKSWMEQMKKDPELVENGIDYTVELDKISEILKGGLSK